MSSKLIVAICSFSALLCVTSCQYVGPPDATHPPDNYESNPQYSFSYEVNDPLTGDTKNHQETRNGDNVQGSYSLVDADGARRIVEYTADVHSGFNAVVHRESASTFQRPNTVQNKKNNK